MSGMDEQIIKNRIKLVCESCDSNHFKVDIRGEQTVYLELDEENLYETDCDVIDESGWICLNCGTRASVDLSYELNMAYRSLLEGGRVDGNIGN